MSVKICDLFHPVLVSHSILVLPDFLASPLKTLGISKLWHTKCVCLKTPNSNNQCCWGGSVWLRSASGSRRWQQHTLLLPPFPPPQPPKSGCEAAAALKLQSLIFYVLHKGWGERQLLFEEITPTTTVQKQRARRWRSRADRGVCAGGGGCRCSEATVQLLSTRYISYGYVTNNVFLRETMTLRKKP